MKNIKLTEIHKSKLLEMCRILFPEYKEIQLGIPQELRKGWGYSGNYLFFDLDIKKEPCIHWFEFCMTHLQFKILGVSDYEKTKTFFMRVLFQCEQPHPIDYLYEEFKKLK